MAPSSTHPPGAGAEPDDAADDRVRLEVWSDVACPWCYVGRRNLAIAIADLEPFDRPRITRRSYQLDAAVPIEGIDADEYAAVRIADPARLADMQAQLVAIGEEVGIEFRFDRQHVVPNTHLAHRVVAAIETDEEREVVLEALFSSYFERGIDIGDAALLEQVVAEALDDTDRAADVLARAQEDPVVASIVDTDIRLARELGITSVPCFVADRAIAVPGAVPPPALARLIAEASDARRAAAEDADEDAEADV